MSGDDAISAVIFDLGGVLIDVQIDRMPELWAAASGADPAKVAEVFWTDTEYQRLERGEISFDAYHRSMAARIGRPITLEQFAEGWTGVFDGLLEGVERLLAGLDGRCRLVCLSNTNILHAQACWDRYPDLLNRFERLFLSHEIGVRKPDPASYRMVLDYLAVPAAAAVFVDDKPANVQAAEDLGIHGVVARGAGQIARELSALGVQASI